MSERDDLRAVLDSLSPLRSTVVSPVRDMPAAPNRVHMLTGCTYDPEAHSYILDGVAVPGVTKVRDAAGLGPDLRFVEPALRLAAAERGRQVHALVEQIDQGTLDRATVLGTGYAGYVAAYDRFLLETDYAPLAWEALVYSRRWGVAGILDKRGFLRRQRAILDIKTPLAIDWPGATIQLEAYRLLSDECHPAEPVAHVYVLQLGPTGRYTLRGCDSPRARRVFLYALRSFRNEATEAERTEITAWQRDHRSAKGPRP